MIRSKIAVFLFAAVAFSTSSVRADDEPAVPLDTNRFVLAPTISISDVGFDTNILTTSKGPKRDTTGNLKLQIEPSIPIGPTRVTGRLSARGAYFRQYTQERAIDTDNSLKFEVQGQRVMAHASGSYLRAHDRFDPEIFVRTLRTESAVEGGTDVAVAGKTIIGVAVSQAHIAFEGTRVALDAGLREALNRRMNTVSVSMRNTLTPLTTLAVIADLQRERFDFMPSRDATSRRILAGLEFKPAALLDGKAYVGYRVFESPESFDSTGRGVVASLDLGYTVANRVRCEIEAERDLAHSYRLTAPYYASTRINTSTTTRVGAWEIKAGAGREWLDYGDNQASMIPISLLQQAALDAASALDRMFHYGAGTRYHLRPDTTVGLDTEYLRFHTDEMNRTYDRLRIVSSLVFRF